MLRRLKFWTTYPFAIAAFKWRERREWRRIVPRRWLSPGEVITQDLQLFEQRDRLDSKFLDDFAKARDDTVSLIKKQTILSALIFVFLLSNYLEIGLDINISGFSLHNTRGIPEGLLLISNLLSCYTLILQANSSVLDATIRAAIKQSVPEELQALYLVRYFPHEQFGRYQPFNMPYLVPSKLQRRIGRIVAILFLVVLILTSVGFASCNLLLLIHYLWLTPSFGVWSHVLLAYILVLGLGAFLYLILTRVRLPYLDYTINHELELLQQVDPVRHRVRLQEVYGPLNVVRGKMAQRGCLNPPQQA